MKDGYRDYEQVDHRLGLAVREQTTQEFRYRMRHLNANQEVFCIKGKKYGVWRLQFLDCLIPP